MAVDDLSPAAHSRTDLRPTPLERRSLLPCHLLLFQSYSSVPGPVPMRGCRAPPPTDTSSRSSVPGPVSMRGVSGGGAHRHIDVGWAGGTSETLADNAEGKLQSRPGPSSSSTEVPRSSVCLPRRIQIPPRSLPTPPPRHAKTRALARALRRIRAVVGAGGSILATPNTTTSPATPVAAPAGWGTRLPWSCVY